MALRLKLERVSHAVRLDALEPTAGEPRDMVLGILKRMEIERIRVDAELCQGRVSDRVGAGLPGFGHGVADKSGEADFPAMRAVVAGGGNNAANPGDQEDRPVQAGIAGQLARRVGVVVDAYEVGGQAGTAGIDPPGARAPLAQDAHGRFGGEDSEAAVVHAAYRDWNDIVMSRAVPAKWQGFTQMAPQIW